MQSRTLTPPIVVLLSLFLINASVVATDVGGTRVLVRDGENGLLVQPGSPEALATALSGAIQEKRRLAHWGKASARLAEAFSWDRVVEQYLALAEVVASGNRPPPDGRPRSPSSPLSLRSFG